MNEPVRTRFPVRGNEIGFTGSVSPGGIARYCEWSRWTFFLDEKASALRAGFKGGVARAQTIEIHGAFTYPEDVVVDLWIARVGGSSLDFGHELRTAGGALVARARVTIVQLGPNGKEPFPEWLASHVLPREAPTPLELSASAPTDGVYTHAWQVRPSDLDQFRHVNQARYVDHADDARLFALGEGHAAGFEGGVRKITVSYEREVRAPDRVSAQLSRRADGTRDFVLVGADGRVANRAAMLPA